METTHGTISERYVVAIEAWSDAHGCIDGDLTPYQFEAYRAWKVAGCDVGRAKELLTLRQIAHKRVSDRCRP